VIGQAPQRAAALPFSEFTARLENQSWPAEPSAVLPPPPEETAASLPEYTLPAPRPAPVPETPLKVRIPDTHAGFPEDALLEAPVSLAVLADLRPLGQLHESFIIAAGRDGLWIIDQHVAHERVLFEKVLRDRAAGRAESQRLLMPMVMQLTAEQQIEYARIAGELEAAGFETEPFGQRTLAVKAAPAGVGLGEVEMLVAEILDIAETELRGLSIEDLRRAVAASIACRAAIKVNTKLDRSKMEWLLAALAATDCPMTCPHGRPVALRYATRDILRGFHRI
jgi:DNA mismatch repair protein MutL